MATIYIQLADKLLKVSGDVTKESIISALGYTPSNFSGLFADLQDSPLVDDGSGVYNIADEAGNIIARFDADGFHSIEMTAGSHKLTEKANKTDVDTAIETLKKSLFSGSFFDLTDNPFIVDESGEVNIVDESGNIGLKLGADGRLYVAEVICGDHILTEKANHTDLASEITRAKAAEEANADNIAANTANITANANAITAINNTIAALDTSLSKVGSNSYVGISITQIDGLITDLSVDDSGIKSAITTINNAITQVRNEAFSGSFNDLSDNPFTIDDTGEVNIVDENGNIGMKLNSDGLHVKNVYIGGNDTDKRITALEELGLELRTLSGGTIVLVSKYDFASEGNVTAGGVASEDSTSISFTRLDSWDDYDATAGAVLSAVLGYELKTQIETLQSKSTNVSVSPALTTGTKVATITVDDTDYNLYAPIVDLNSYATQSWVQSQGYLTEHQDLSNYLTITSAADTYQPKGNYLTAIPSEYVTDSELTAKGYLTGITSSMVTTALGYTPYDASNPKGYITGITDEDVYAVLDSQGGLGNTGQGLGITSLTKSLVVNALGYTPLESVTLPTSLPNPYALSWSGYSSGSYDGSAAKSITIPTTLPASDVYAWAKASTKPSYAFSEITDKPTTLAGYGITNALSTAGGTISGSVLLNTTDIAGLTVNRTNSKYSAIHFLNSENGDVGYLGAIADEEPVYITSGGSVRNLIHSGNILSYKAGSANNLAGVYANENINYGRGDIIAMQMIYGTASNSVSLGYPNQYVSGVSVITGYTGWQMVTYGGPSLPNPYFRKQIDDGSWADWKQLAFLTDNVASAQNLTHSNGVIGATVTSDGNISATGNITAAGNITAGAASDRRLKTDITSIAHTDAIGVLMTLNPVSFAWNGIATSKDNNLVGKSVGFLADEYENIINNSGRNIWGEYRAIDYKLAIPYLVTGWQNHETRLEMLERENNELKLEINMLKSIINGIN